MTSTRLHITIVAVVAAFCIALAAAPAAQALATYPGPGGVPTRLHPGASARANDASKFKPSKQYTVQKSYCDDAQTMLRWLEAEADARSGTPAAAPYARAADALYAAAKANGCGWAV